MSDHLNRRAFGALVAGAGITLTSRSFAGTPAGVFVDFGVAIRGADPVAFFRQGAAVEGSQSHAHQWKGAKWLFASAANRDRFAAAPERYAPAYGGWCAFAMARGILAKTDPTAWLIEDDQLYLNFDSRTKTRFERDVPGNIAKANANWEQKFS
ncbi:MAG: YHS domain-containing (seleno)protein [Pseudomonadota bacterium]